MQADLKQKESAVALKQETEQAITLLFKQARAYAHCACPDAPAYHSNCARHLMPILDKLDTALSLLQQKNEEITKAYEIKLTDAEEDSQIWHQRFEASQERVGRLLK